MFFLEENEPGAGYLFKAKTGRVNARSTVLITRLVRRAPIRAVLSAATVDYKEVTDAVEDARRGKGEYERRNTSGSRIV